VLKNQVLLFKPNRRGSELSRNQRQEIRPGHFQGLCIRDSGKFAEVFCARFENVVEFNEDCSARGTADSTRGKRLRCDQKEKLENAKPKTFDFDYQYIYEVTADALAFGSGA
jgi:hypothetical protein